MVSKKENTEELFILHSKEKKKPKYVFFGVPDETGSRKLAKFKGSKKAPDSVRFASHLLSSFHRKDKDKTKHFITNTYKEIYEDEIPLKDAGNIKKRPRQKNERHNE